MIQVIRQFILVEGMKYALKWLMKSECMRCDKLLNRQNKVVLNLWWMKIIEWPWTFFYAFIFNCATSEVVFVKKCSSIFDNLMNNSELCTGAEYWMMILWKEGCGTALPQAFKNMMTSFCQRIIHYNKLKIQKQTNKQTPTPRGYSG